MALWLVESIMNEAIEAWRKNQSMQGIFRRDSTTYQSESVCVTGTKLKLKTTFVSTIRRALLYQWPREILSVASFWSGGLVSAAHARTQMWNLLLISVVHFVNCWPFLQKQYIGPVFRSIRSSRGWCIRTLQPGKDRRGNDLTLTTLFLTSLACN